MVCWQVGWVIVLCTLVHLLVVETSSISDTAHSQSKLPLSATGAKAESDEEVFSYLQKEYATIGMIQSSLLKRLHALQIPIGVNRADLQTAETSSDDVLTRIATSTEETPIECRVTLGQAPIGSKCVAPCECTGSQKWVQFSVLNKLRRKDPSAWVTCPTCRSPYRHDLFMQYGGVKAGVVSAVLDNFQYIRVGTIVLSALLGYFLGVPDMILRFLVSRTFWQQYPMWSKIAHLPFPVKIWAGRSVLALLFMKYMAFEKALIVEKLADIETRLIEDALP